MPFIDVLSSTYVNAGMYGVAKFNNNYCYVKTFGGFICINLNDNTFNKIAIDTGNSLGGVCLTDDGKFLGYASSYFGSQNQCSIYSLFDPMNPVLVKSFSLGGSAVTPISINNDIFFFCAYIGGNATSVYVFDTLGNIKYTYVSDIYIVAATSLENNVILAGQSKSQYLDVINSYNYSMSGHSIYTYNVLPNSPSLSYSNGYVIFFNSSYTETFYRIFNNNKIMTGTISNSIVNTICHENATISLDGRFLSFSTVNGNPQYYNVIYDLFDGIAYYTSDKMVGGIIMMPNNKIFAYDGNRFHNFYNGVYNPLSVVNGKVGNGYDFSSINYYKLYNMYRPVSILGQYKS